MLLFLAVDFSFFSHHFLFRIGDGFLKTWKGACMIVVASKTSTSPAPRAWESCVPWRRGWPPPAGATPRCR